jgi:hypothetical protein
MTGTPMPRDWVDEGLRHTREREEQQRAESARRHHHTALIKEKGPELMRDLVNEVRAAVDEFRSKTAGSGDHVEFEELPREGFCVTRSDLPKVALECRPDYEAHVLYCNTTRVEDHDSETSESLFNLNFTVDESDRVRLRHATGPFLAVGEAVEFLLKPVLFPLVHHRS